MPRQMMEACAPSHAKVAILKQTNVGQTLDAEQTHRSDDRNDEALLKQTNMDSPSEANPDATISKDPTGANAAIISKDPRRANTSKDPAWEHLL